MSLIVMIERQISESHWTPYLRSIQDPLCPAFYKEAELKEIQNSWIETMRTIFLEEAMESYRVLIADASIKKLFDSLFPSSASLQFGPMEANVTQQAWLHEP